MHLNHKRRKEVFTLIVVFVVVLLGSGLAVYLIANRGANQPERTATATSSSETGQSRTAQEKNFFEQMLDPPNTGEAVSQRAWLAIISNVALRLLLASLLGAALAFRPRRQVLALKRNPYVAQTQILLAVVASALMMVVGDNAARAFGIFAAVSLVRFRTNIRDPKEITVLLISLAIGLATGVGRWDLAMLLAFFALILLWVLEYREPEQASRSMNLKIRTSNVAATQELVGSLFRKHGFDSELRGINHSNGDNAAGELVYSVDLTTVFTTDELSREILEGSNHQVGSLEWDQKKSFSYIYR